MLEAPTTVAMLKMIVKLCFWLNLLQTKEFFMKFENLKAS